MSESPAVTHLLFDLGGVVVELRGAPLEPEWLAGIPPPETIWRTWLTSDAPREFEAGKIDARTFARRIVDELDLDATPEAVMARFERLPVGPFPGALELLHALKRRYRTALFSNSNALHWPRKMNEMGLDTAFHEHFASHLMGHVKPDAEAFAHVIDAWGVDPGRILFVDDNALNVEAGGRAGMRAERVVGLDGLRTCLARHGIDADGA